MPIKLTKRKLVTAAIESSYGAGATVTGSDAILVEEPTYNPVESARILERLGITGALSVPAQGVIGRVGGFSMAAELKAGTGLGVAPEVGPLLRICGLTETLDPGTDAVYATAGFNNAQSGFVRYWDGGADAHDVVGIRGSLTLALEGSYGKWNFSLMGHPATPSAVTRLTPSYDGNTPPPLKSLPFTLGGNQIAEVYTATLDMQTTLSMPEALTTNFANSGYAEAIVTEFNPQLTVSMAAADIADGYNPYADMDGQTARALVIGAIGAAGNQVTVNAPAAIVLGISEGDNEGRMTYDITYQLAEATLGAQDNFTVQFA